MRHGRILSVAVMVASATTLEAASRSCDPADASVRAARAVATGIVAADNARDLERVLGFYADNAILMPPGEETVSGREAIRPRYVVMFSVFDPRIEARVDEACAEGGMAFVRGHNGGSLVPRAGGGTRALDDDWLMQLRRDADGTWRITHLMWHPAGAGDPKPGAARAEVEGALREYALLQKAADAVRLSAFYTQDGELIEPGMQPLTGPEAIRKFLESFGAVRIETSSMDPEATEVFGDQAFQWGVYAQRVALAGQPPAEYRGRFVAQWSRQATGQWLIRRLLTQPSPAP